MEQKVVLTAQIFPWNKNFETGLQQIDEQHNKLVNLLNLLASHLGHQSDASTLHHVFNELVEYASYHFATEEKVWHHCFLGDAWEIDHQKVHSGFASSVAHLKEKISTESVGKVFEDTLSFMTHWLAFHILDSDIRMAMVVQSVRSGLTLEQSKKYAEKAMSGSMKVLIDTLLSMYDHLSSRSLELMREVVARQKAEDKLRLAANAFNNTMESICITDADMIIIDANPAFYQMTQFPSEEALGKSLKALKSGFEDKTLFSTIQQALGEQGHWRGEICNRAKSGELEAEWLTISSVKDAREDTIVNYVVVFSNISHLIKQRQDLEYMAQYDVLTDLPNRLLLSDRLLLAIAHAERKGLSLAVCYLDLDGFKPVNDRFGHATGDQTLQEIAQRLKKVIRGDDTVARLGGDEFVVLFGDLKKPEDCLDLLDRLLHEIAQPIHVQSDVVNVTVSIGVTFFPQDNAAPDVLLQHADEAMYHAKRLGKSKYCFYDVDGKYR